MKIIQDEKNINEIIEAILANKDYFSVSEEAKSYLDFKMNFFQHKFDESFSITLTYYKYEKSLRIKISDNEYGISDFSFTTFDEKHIEDVQNFINEVEEKNKSCENLFAKSFINVLKYKKSL